MPHIYSAQVLAYNPQTVTDPPKSFGDLLDPKWKGKVGVVATAGFWLMMAAGLSPAATRTISTRPSR